MCTGKVFLISLGQEMEAVWELWGNDRLNPGIVTPGYCKGLGIINSMCIYKHDVFKINFCQEKKNS